MKPPGTMEDKLKAAPREAKLSNRGDERTDPARLR